MLKTSDSAELNILVETVLASGKYKDICPDLVRRIGAQELERRRTLKEALKSTKNKLHQVGGAYLDSRADSQNWLELLRNEVQSQDKSALQAVCRNIMQYHASTRERLPILDQFYSTIFTDLPPVSSILDIACGLNPLTIPWMPLQGQIAYYAYDMYQQLTDLIHEWLQLLHIQGHAQVCDVIQHCPTHEVDVALLLKTIPCLEQVDKQAGYHLLRTINAQYLVVSYPLHSLGGKSKGMLTHYESHFNALITGETWSIQRHEFATELVFVIKK